MNLTAVGLVKTCPAWSHYCYKTDPNKPNLNATTLLRAATIVRDRRDIGDRIDSNTERSQRANGRLTARSWPLDLNIEILDSLFDGCSACDF